MWEVQIRVQMLETEDDSECLEWEGVITGCDDATPEVTARMAPSS